MLPKALFNILRHAPRALVVCADWRRPPFSRPFDTVIAADVIYETQCLGPVLGFMRDFTDPGADVIVADPCRAPWEEFKKGMKESGFATRASYCAVVNEGKTTIEVLHMRNMRTGAHS